MDFVPEIVASKQLSQPRRTRRFRLLLMGQRIREGGKGQQKKKPPDQVKDSEELAKFPSPSLMMDLAEKEAQTTQQKPPEK